MPVLTQPPTQGDVLKYEINPNYCRETVGLLPGSAYPVGAVLGRVTASGKYTFSPATGSDGAELAACVLLYAVDATVGEPIGVVLTRGPAIISRAALIWDGSVDDTAKIEAKLAELTALGIIPRNTA